jgi:hypothetical protein
MVDKDTKIRTNAAEEWKRPTLSRIRVDQAENTGDKIGVATDGGLQGVTTANP